MEEVGESRAFHRMSSQRRRKLWSLAARAAAKCPDETEKAHAPPVLTSESTSVSPFWSKDSLVKTQDSGVSVDLHSDVLQCGSMSASFSSAQQRVSFDVKHPSQSPGQLKSPRVAPRRLHSDQEYFPSEWGHAIRPRSGSGLSGRNCLTISVPQEGVDPGAWRTGRNQPSRKRKVSSQLWGSAETSGLGSSLDWASVDVVQQPGLRHFSASLPQHAQRPTNPIAMRSLDEPLTRSGLSGVFQTTPRNRPPDHKLISSHNSPVGSHHTTRSIHLPIPSNPVRAERIRQDFYHRSHVNPSGRSPSIVTPVPYLVTRSLDQADLTHRPHDSTSPRISGGPELYNSVPGSIGRSTSMHFTRMNPRYAYGSMQSNSTECATFYGSWLPTERSSLYPATAAASIPPAVHYLYRPGYPVASLCELPLIDVGPVTDSSRRRTLEYESPSQRRDYWAERSSFYRRSRTLDETSGYRSHGTDRRCTRIMYSVPPPTDSMSPLLPRKMGYGPGPSFTARRQSVYDPNVEHVSQRTAWALGTGPGLAIPSHRMHHSREETILEDWDAEQDRWAHAPTEALRPLARCEDTVRRSALWYSPEQPIAYRKELDEPPMKKAVCLLSEPSPTMLSSASRKRPLQPSPHLPSVQTHTGYEETMVARRNAPEDSGPSVRGTTSSSSRPIVSHSHDRSGDQPRAPRLSDSTTRLPSAVLHSDSSSSSSSSSELRCLKAPQTTIRSSINDRPLVHPAFRVQSSLDKTHSGTKDPLARSSRSGITHKPSTPADRVPKPLPSALKHRGPDSTTDQMRAKRPEKRVSLEEEEEEEEEEGEKSDEELRHVDQEAADHMSHRDPNAMHLFIDPTVIDPETDGAQPAVTEGQTESAQSPVRPSARIAQTQAVSSSVRSRAVGSGVVAYDQSRLAIHISTAEVEQFAEYWDHSVFAAARISAVGLATVATVCLICSSGASTWIYRGQDLNMTHSGFWKRCNYVNETCELTIPFLTKRDGWQDGALCILLLAILLGLLGMCLSMAGHLVFALSKRLYYFHSSGEAHVVAAFVTALATLIFHVTAVVHLQTDVPIRFGAAYGITWFACILHLICAFLLSLDEVLHRLAIRSNRVACIRVCMHCLIDCYGRAQAKRRAFQTSQALRRKRKLETQIRAS